MTMPEPHSGALDARDQRLLSTFLELVAIDSPSGEEAAVAEYCANALRKLGGDVTIDDTGAITGSNTGNVIADFAPTAAGIRVALCAHLDTVEPGRGIVPVVEDGIVRPAGPTILGGDDKTGVAAIIEVVTRLRESGTPHAGVRVLLTTDEERGLRGAKALDPSHLLDCGACLVLDADGSPGGIVLGAPTHLTFEARFTGRAAHAGVSPQDGISALVMAANAVCGMELGRLDDETTANVGSINGGGATNIVTAEALMTGECRSLRSERVEQVRSEMDQAMRSAAADAGGTVDLTWTREYGGYLRGADDEVYRLAAAACSDAGLVPRPYTTGGGADANVLADTGVPVLALSSGMRNVHSVDEIVHVADLVALAALLEAVLVRATESSEV